MTSQKCNCCRYFLSLPLGPKESEMKPQNFSYLQGFGSAFFSGPISEWCWPPSVPLEVKIWIKAAKDTEIFSVAFLCLLVGQGPIKNSRYNFSLWGPTEEPIGAVCRMDPLPKVFALLSKHTDTSRNGKPLQNAQCQLTDCLIHVLVHFPIHCTVFACTIYAGKKKTQEMKCNVQATSYLLAVYSHTQTLGSVLFSQKQGKIWEGFLVK